MYVVGVVGRSFQPLILDFMMDCRKTISLIGELQSIRIPLIVYHITGKFGSSFNLAIWRI